MTVRTMGRSLNFISWCQMDGDKHGVCMMDVGTRVTYISSSGVWIHLLDSCCISSRQYILKTLASWAMPAMLSISFLLSIHQQALVGCTTVRAAR